MFSFVWVFKYLIACQNFSTYFYSVLLQLMSWVVFYFCFRPNYTLWQWKNLSLSEISKYLLHMGLFTTFFIWEKLHWSLVPQVHWYDCSCMHSLRFSEISYWYLGERLPFFIKTAAVRSRTYPSYLKPQRDILVLTQVRSVPWKLNLASTSCSFCSINLPVMILACLYMEINTSVQIRKVDGIMKMPGQD